MVDKDEILKEFGLEHLSPEEQDAFYDNFTYELGAEISDGLSEEQLAEFTQIVNGNDEVINAWLAANTPDYRDEPAFKELQAGYDEDSEKVPAEKVYASLAWVRVNRPDFNQILARVKREFKVQIDARKTP